MRLIAYVIIALMSSSLYGQLQFANVKHDGERLNNIPRFSWAVPYEAEIFEVAGLMQVNLGGTIKNEGIVYNFNGHRHNHRVISLGPTLMSYTALNKALLIFGGGFDYNLHYKEKWFRDGSRNHKEILNSEWFSDRVRPFNYYARAGFGMRNGVYLYGEYYFNGFYNPEFTENLTGGPFQPYKDFDVTRFNIGIGVYFFDERD